jgi:nitrite reductase (NO-forming)
VSVGTEPPPTAGYRRLPVEEGPGRRPRARRHAAYATIVACYAVAAVVAAMLGDRLPVPRWLALHLLLLGAVTNAVFVWSRHFAQALLHAPPGGDRAAAARATVLNIGILCVLVGVGWDHGRVTEVGTAAVVAAVGWHVASLVRMSRGSRLTGKLRDAVWFYAASGAALAAGAVLGSLMATGRFAAEHERLHLAHVHLNLLGWIGLAVVGTTFMLWPAVLRTRMVEEAPAAARRTLLLMATGLAAAAAGLLAGQRWIAVAGMVAYLAGVAVSLLPFARTARQKAPHTASAWALAAGTAWLGVSAVVDIVALGRGGAAAVSGLDRIVPVLAVGLAAQVLMGALTFLLPVTLGGGPAGNRRMTAELEQGWIPRAVVANTGVLLLALPTAGAARTAGWVMAVAGLGAFLPLLLSALTTVGRTEDETLPPPLRVVTVTALTAVVTVLALVATGTWPGGRTSVAVPADAPTRTVAVSLVEFAVQPATITVPAGTHLVLDVRNRGAMDHDLRLQGGPGTSMLAPGQSQRLDAGVVSKGLLAWCTVPGHKAAGMVLAIHVSGRPPAAGGPGGMDAMPGRTQPGGASAPAWTAYDPALKPLAGGTEHRVTLHARDVVREIAPGVRQQLWTFDGTAPGPVLHGRVGDLFTVRLVNDSPMTHSLDLHAEQVAPDIGMRPVPPGGSVVYQFRAMHAGAWLYHCGVEPMLQHVAMGMYGAIVIEPIALVPAQSFVFVQSDLYRGPAGGVPSMGRLMSADPDYVVFNGYADQYVHAPIHVRAGQPIRLWLVDAGPNVPSSLHVVGAQFTTVFKEGGYLLQPGNAQAGAASQLDLEPGEGGFVEFTLPAAGRYSVVDHRLADAARGAMGVFVAN